MEGTYRRKNDNGVDLLDENSVYPQNGAVSPPSYSAGNPDVSFAPKPANDLEDGTVKSIPEKPVLPEDKKERCVIEKEIESVICLQWKACISAHSKMAERALCHIY